MNTESAQLNLGLIGDNIGRSRSPLLHRLAGNQTGIEVTYDRLVPKEIGLSFEDVFAKCAKSTYRGINITYPYKERAFGFVTVEDALVRSIGAVNTVIFEPDGPRGYNTDFSGFMAAYRRTRGETAPGRVCMIGTGGVGRAVAFGLLGLGASEIRLVDRDPAKARALAEALRASGNPAEIAIFDDAVDAASGAQGLINCTPVGMVGHEGTPMPKAAMQGAEWAFDAVYTPPDTQFLTDAEAQGLAIISGWELFFFQGVHAWKLFANRGINEADLRTDLLAPEV